MQHFEFEEQIALYSLGDLDAADEARLAEHLEICPSCRAALSEYQFVANELLTQVPARTAPAALGVRLQNLAAADARRAPARAPAPTAAPTRFWNRQLSVPRWGLALVLLALLALLGISAALAFALRQSNASSDQIAQMLAARDLKFVSLSGAMGAQDKGSGFICLSPDKETGLLWLYGLEPLDYDHVYQVWLHDNGTRESGGTFRSDYEGRAVAVVKAPRPFGSYKEIGITVEPASGSQWPTGNGVIEGKLD